MIRYILTTCLALFSWFHTSMAATGSRFKATLDNGLTMEFTVTDEEKKECKVGGNGICIPKDYADEVVIPSTINGYFVTSIAKGAFGLSDMTSIFIPSTIVSMEDDAFYDCKYLETIDVNRDNPVYTSRSNTWNNNDVIVEKSTMTLVVGCKNSNIFWDIKVIGKSAFNGCSKMTYVYLPQTVETIERSAFSDCEELKQIRFSEGLKTIKEYAFHNCKSLLELNLPSSLTSISDHAFGYCERMEKVQIPSGLLTIGEYAFANCESLVSINFPPNIKIINSYTFYNCRSLKEAKMEEGMEELGNECFRGCTSLESVFIPSSVKRIGVNPFSECPSISSLEVASSNSVYDSRSVCNAIIETKTNTLVTGCNTTVIPNTVETIGVNSFFGSRQKELEIPSSVTSIGQYAFFESGMASVTIPENLREIGIYAFSACDNLRFFVVLNKTPITIDKSVFGWVHPVIYVPVGCKEFYQNAEVWNEYEIREMNSNTLRVKFEINGQGVISINDHVEKDQYSYDDLDDYYDDLGYTYSNGGEYYFQKGDTLTINMSYEPLMKYYMDGKDLTETLKTKEGSLEEPELFEFESKVFTTQIDNVQKDVSIQVDFIDGESVVDNVNYGFYQDEAYVKARTEIIWYEWLPEPSGLRSLYDGTVIVPESVHTVKKDYKVAGVMANAFDKSVLQTIILPSSVKWIKGEAFKSCLQLYHIDLPAQLETIAGDAFADCENLSNIRVNGKTPFPLADKTFDNIGKMKLYVPVGSKEAYSKSEVWKDFGSIVESDKTFTVTIHASGDGNAMVLDRIISNQTISMTVKEGDYLWVNLNPESNYEVGSLIVEGGDFKRYETAVLVKDISSDVKIDVAFSSIPYYTLKLRTIGDGSLSIGEWIVGGVWSWDSSYEIYGNSSGQLSYPKGSVVGMLVEHSERVKIMVDGEIIKPFSTEEEQFHGYEFEVGISHDTEVIAVFSDEEDAYTDILTYEGVNYVVASKKDKLLKATLGNYSESITIPNSIHYYDTKTERYQDWEVTGIDNHAFSLCADLKSVRISSGISSIGKGLFTRSDHIAALQWESDQILDDETMGEVNNPNFLLYVKKSSQNKTSVKNVIENGYIDNLVLEDTKEGGDFFCPKAFTASKVYYTHQYGMLSGIGESRGWETIALPFNVNNITYADSELVPFAAYGGNNGTKPFWLYEYSATGWQSPGIKQPPYIKANTPYIICMPNNPVYDDIWNVKGEVTFSATNVQVMATSGLVQNTYNGRKFSPAYSYIDKQDGIFALNVHNTFSQNNSEYLEGSHFINNLRSVHPFEAYMTSTNGSYAPIGIFDDLPTDIPDLLFMAPGEVSGTGSETPLRVTTLSGQVVREVPPATSLDNALKGLPKGVYIVGNRKVVVK